MNIEFKKIKTVKKTNESKTKKQILEQNTTKLKNSIACFNSTFHQAKDRISVFEDGSFEINQSEEQKRKKWNNAYGTPTREQYIHYRNPRRRERRESVKQ